MRKIGPNHGAEILRQRLQETDPGDQQFAIDTVLGEPGKTYPNNRPLAKATGTLRILVEDHDEAMDAQAAQEQRIEELEARVNRLPFPFVGSSPLGG